MNSNPFLPEYYTLITDKRRYIGNGQEFEVIMCRDGQGNWVCEWKLGENEKYDSIWADYSNKKGDDVYAATLWCL